MWTLLAIGTVWTLSASGPDRAPATVVHGAANTESQGHLRSYLTRDVAPSARFLDHGVVGVTTAAGAPHKYRVGLSLGILDHLTIGATAHWLPQQSVPGWSPTASIAFWRSRRLDVGVGYHQTLYPPPLIDTDPVTPAFVQRTHWVLGALTVNQAWLSGGVDLGLVRARERDERTGGSEDLDTPYVVRHRFGGGLHLRAGTRRWGVTAQALWPQVEAELMLDLRFGGFEIRRKGGWWPPRTREVEHGRGNY